MSKKAVIILISIFVLVIVAIFVATAIYMGNDGSAQPKDSVDNEVAKLDQGKFLLEDGTTDYEKLAEETSQMIAEGEATADVYQNQGVAYYNLDDLDGAKASYESAIKADSSDATNYIYLGNVLRDQGDLDGAESQYRKAIRLDSTSATAYINMAVMKYAMLGDKAGAIKVLQEGLKSIPGDARLTQLLEQYK